MIDLEIALAKNLGWSLHDLDRTDVESLIPFVMRFDKTTGPSQPGKQKKKVYCDQVNL